MEFSVRMTCKSCAENVKSKLSVSGICDVHVDVPNNTVLVETELTTSQVHGLLESTGLPVFFKGFGTSQQTHDIRSGAAVVALKGEGAMVGLVRMVQSLVERCVIEATIDGLPVGDYTINIHELGDLSSGGDSCGDFYDGDQQSSSLGSCRVVNEGDRASLQMVSCDLQVSNLIGRSVVVSSGHSRVMYGIIARSAGLFENPKQLCTCDGVSVWDEARKNRQLMMS